MNFGDCVVCGRRCVNLSEHQCPPRVIEEIDRDDDTEWIEDRWEEVDEVDRLNHGLELMEQ